MRRERAIVRCVLGLCIGAMLLLSALGPTPAHAQVMRDEGFLIPWFHSRAEKLARQACQEELPQCRDSVRQQMAAEKAFTIFAPWVLLALFIWGAVIYVRRKEAQKEARRHEAERHHVREKQAKRPQSNMSRREILEDAEDQPTGLDDDLDDMGPSRPGNRRR